MDPQQGDSSIQHRSASAHHAPMKRKSYNWTLPPEIESRLGQTTYGRQRAISGGGHLLVILHAPPAHGSAEREAVLLLRKPEGQLLVNGFEGGEMRTRRLLADYRERLDALDERTEAAQGADEILAAFALPLTAMATLLGMNVQHGLEGRPPGMFWIVLAAGTAVGFAVRGWVTR